MKKKKLSPKTFTEKEVVKLLDKALFFKNAMITQLQKDIDSLLIKLRELENKIQ